MFALHQSNSIQNQVFEMTTPIYQLADIARAKLIHQAERADHDYRRLVLHANLLDNLLLELDSQRQAEARTKEEVMRRHMMLHKTQEPVVFLENEAEIEDGGVPGLMHESDDSEESGEEEDSFEVERRERLGARSTVLPAVEEGRRKHQLGAEEELEEDDLTLRRMGPERKFVR